MTVEELRKSKNYREHHTASRRGYASRKSNGYVEPYSGRFGKGYALITPRYDTTQYVDITYFISK